MTENSIDIPLDGVKVIYDTEQAINFLSELQDRSLINFLEGIGNSGTPAIIIQRGVADKLYTLVLFNYPEWMSPEKVDTCDIAVFYCPTILGLIQFFHQWKKRVDHEQRAVLNDVLYFLYTNEAKAKHLPPF